MVQTRQPLHQDPSTLLFPASERLQSLESAWIPPPSSVSQELHNITPGKKKFTSMFLLLNIAVINLSIHLASYLWFTILEPMQSSDYIDLKIRVILN